MRNNAKREVNGGRNAALSAEKRDVQKDETNVAPNDVTPAVMNVALRDAMSVVPTAEKSGVIIGEKSAEPKDARNVAKITGLSVAMSVGQSAGPRDAIVIASRDDMPIGMGIATPGVIIVTTRRHATTIVVRVIIGRIIHVPTIAG